MRLPDPFAPNSMLLMRLFRAERWGICDRFAILLDRVAFAPASHDRFGKARPLSAVIKLLVSG
jgi:hypothetical protein